MVRHTLAGNYKKTLDAAIFSSVAVIVTRNVYFTNREGVNVMWFVTAVLSFLLITHNKITLHFA